MFDSVSLLTLQQYWWAIISLLGGGFSFSPVCARWTNIDLHIGQK